MRPLPVIPRERLPHFWAGMGWTAKCGWLLSAHLVRDYAEACAALKAMRAPAARKNRPSVAQYQAGLEKRGLA